MQLSYAPNDGDEKNKNLFHEQLQRERNQIPCHDIIISMGDINIIVGDDNSDAERSMVHHGCGGIDDNMVKVAYSQCSCPVLSGVRLMSALFFNVALTGDKKRGIRWNLFTSREDLNLRDDLALLSLTHGHIQEKTNKVNIIREADRLENQQEIKLR
ncbi:endonuclease-reverse transcriptase [Elysia marginata]|uniref:Endonuclease-reverse transcriptase n=1 Tax=Elysia marginata TaxID=1093978 RepID=A0AAV4G9J6_9GAST|nr:endonuclease-reverse transcriptase [Elysia marginata]